MLNHGVAMLFAISFVACGGNVRIGDAYLDGGSAGGAGSTGGGGGGNGGSSAAGGSSGMDGSGGFGASGATDDGGLGDEYVVRTNCENYLRFYSSAGWLVFDMSEDVPDSGMTTPRAIVAMRTDGSELKHFTDGTHIDTEPAYAPDAKTMSFTSDRAGTRQIFLMDLDGAIRQLTHRPEGADQSSFSPDGKLVVFRSGGSIYTVDLLGSEQLIVPRVSKAYSWPTFTPDGSEIIFDGGNEIDAVLPDGTGFRQIVKQWSNGASEPKLSQWAVAPLPDGGGFDVVYSATCDGDGAELFTTPSWNSVLPCDGNRVTKEAIGYSATHPIWANGGELAYVRIDQSTQRASIVMTGRWAFTPCEVTPLTMDARNPMWAR
jgi:hypothetical protein